MVVTCGFKLGAEGLCVCAWSRGEGYFNFSHTHPHAQKVLTHARVEQHTFSLEFTRAVIYAICCPTFLEFDVFRGSPSWST